MQPEPRHQSLGGFIAGTITGFVVGGLSIGAITLLVTLQLAESVSNGSHPGLTLIPAYVIAIAIGAGGFLLSRRFMNFWSGLIIGTAAGMLGLTALCNLIVSSGNM